MPEVVADKDASNSSRSATPHSTAADDGHNVAATKQSHTGNAAVGEMEQSRELTPPPLPPRPDLPDRLQSYAGGSLRLSKQSPRPQLQSHATTALSLTDVHTQIHLDSNSLHSSPTSQAVSREPSTSNLGRFASSSNSEGDDSASRKSYVPTLDAKFDGESLLSDGTGDEGAPAWKALDTLTEQEQPFHVVLGEDDVVSTQIRNEFVVLPPYDVEGPNEDALQGAWLAKLKHFFILSASGKPIYSRHGDDQLVSHYVGVVQTLISSYQGADDPLKSFTAGDTRFVMLSKGPLNLVAISRLGESEAQLKMQLESLYMQILSTLTLPSMERMFSKHPSTDLRRPLQGTDVLLDGLADGFTRGSPSTLLSALECLRMRKGNRMAINDAFLKVRSANLLYGLIVAAGRLVSVVRPKKHSLHPGDLRLVFNMLFEAGSVRTGGGENWIPLCLPGFNNTGYLHMYVSFFSTTDGMRNARTEGASPTDKNDELAIILISANKESFYELRRMRDDLVNQLEKNGLTSIIKNAIQKSHASCNELVPHTVLKHFLYKSRGNVQFVMPSLEADFDDVVARRKLMSLYHTLHESIHSRTVHLKVLQYIARDATALAWETPLFELYCIAGPSASRAHLVQGANRVVQWIRREEDRVFIIGGAVF